MPSPVVVVRAARIEDVEPVLAMYAAVAGEGRWIGRELPLDEELARTRIRQGIEAPGDYATVAELSPAPIDAAIDVAIDAGIDTYDSEDPAFGRLVGQLHLGVAPYGVAELGMLVVPSMRGRGIGRALLEDAIRWAHDQPAVHKIGLQVWPHNEAALQLYRDCGFEQEGYLRRHYRRKSGELWDAIVMGRSV